VVAFQIRISASEAVAKTSALSLEFHCGISIGHTFDESIALNILREADVVDGSVVASRFQSWCKVSNSDVVYIRIGSSSIEMIGCVE
jgi:hypothetical protein